VKLDVDFPSSFLPKKESKKRRSNRLPFPQFCVEALKQLPSYQMQEYLFPARPNIKYTDASKFQKPHACHIGKRFRRIRNLADIKDLRVHDLRHFATTMLFMEGVADTVIRKMTGHRSDELERYKHFSPDFSRQTTELIDSKLMEGLNVPNLSHLEENEESRQIRGLENPDSTGFSDGADGA
jgi:integrase